MLSLPRTSLPPGLIAALVLIALLALAGPALIVAFPPAVPPLRRTIGAPARVVPPAELPPVEPVAFQALAPADARAFNATVPFSTGPNPAARPFHLSGSDDDRSRAVDCMAAAMLYEAGDDPVGERAVGQVVINRTRHPAFPKSICAVVFQGSERTTGCQFTFTCDGALDRAPNPASWQRAQRLATAALTGAVFAKVGYSTHYHTDWVVPYWSASLDKVAAVNTHLFFRWTGWWGTPPAFRRSVDDLEPLIVKLAPYSPVHAAAPMIAVDPAVVGSEPAAADASGEPTVSGDPNTFLVAFDRKFPPDQLPIFARRTCGGLDHCKLMGWANQAAIPTSYPISAAQIATMTFSYLRDRASGFDKPLWNCTVHRRANPRECMKAHVSLSLRPADNFRLERLPGARVMPIKPAAVPTASATPRTPPPAKP